MQAQDTTQLKAQNQRAIYLLDVNPDSSIYLSESVVKTLEGKSTRSYQLLKGQALVNLGQAYDRFGDFARAIGYFEQSLKIAEAIGDPQMRAASMNDLAQIHEASGDVDNAFKYYRQGLDLLRSVKDKQGESDALNNMAHVFQNKKMYDSALVYFSASKNIRDAIKDTFGIAMSLNNLGTFYYLTGKFDEAEKYFKASIPLRKIMHDRSGMAASLTNLAHVYIRAGKQKEAIEAGLEAMRISRELNQPHKIRSSAKILYSIYKITGNAKEALVNYEIYIQMHDSLNRESNKKASIKSQLKYEYEKKATADSVRTAEEKKVVQVQLQHEQTQRYALYGGLALVALFAVFMVNRFRVTHRQKKVIEVQKREVEQQKHVVEEKQKEILDSIYYARRIQRALITSERYIEKQLKKRTA